MRRSMHAKTLFLLFAFAQMLTADEPEADGKVKLAEKVIDAIATKKIDILGPFDFKDGQLGYLTTKSVGIFRFMQITGDDSALVGYEENPGRFLGEPFAVLMATNGFVDGALFPNKQIPLVVDGTTTYATAIGGTKTVHVLKAVDREVIETSIKVLDNREEQECTRQWSDSSGKFSVKAVFIKFGQGNATLQRLDTGKEIEVPVSKLDKASRDWIQAWSRGRKQREEIRKVLAEMKTVPE